MSRSIFGFATWLVAAAASTTAFGAVTMSSSGVAPATGLSDQFDFTDDATVPGGTTPGGGTYNSQAFSDNGGPPGQTFTTPAGGPLFKLNSVSLKGANTGGGNSGGDVFTTATWGIRISSVSGTTLTPLNTVTGIATVAGATGIEWYTWTFTGAVTCVVAESLHAVCLRRVFERGISGLRRRHDRWICRRHRVQQRRSGPELFRHDDGQSRQPRLRPDVPRRAASRARTGRSDAARPRGPGPGSAATAAIATVGQSTDTVNGGPGEPRLPAVPRADASVPRCADDAAAASQLGSERGALGPRRHEELGEADPA